MVLYNTEAIVQRTGSTVWTTYPFGDDRQLTANNYIQEQKTVSTKNGKGTIGYDLMLNTMTSLDEYSELLRSPNLIQEQKSTPCKAKVCVF